jgi:hypothetical protein
VLPDAFKMLCAEVKPGVSMVTGDEIYMRSNGTKCGVGPFYGQPISAADVARSPLIAHKGIVRYECIELAKTFLMVFVH